jgi:hypothetical protein
MINKKNAILFFLITFLFLVTTMLTGCYGVGTSVNEIKDAFNYPNPFSPTSEDINYRSTNVQFTFVNNSAVTKLNTTIRIKDINGRLVWYFNTDANITDTTAGDETPINIMWTGKNNEGETVSQGIYTAEIILQTLEAEEGGFGGDALSTEINIAVE